MLPNPPEHLGRVVMADPALEVVPHQVAEPTVVRGVGQIKVNQ
jgi:hypothetical protein